MQSIFAHLVKSYLKSSYLALRAPPTIKQKLLASLLTFIFTNLIYQISQARVVRSTCPLQSAHRTNSIDS